MSLYVPVYIVYTVLNRGYTGRSVEVCIRNFKGAAGFLLFQVNVSIKDQGHPERGVNGICTDFVYFMDNDPCFLATDKICFRDF